jgi:hypothetical protein
MTPLTGSRARKVRFPRHSGTHETRPATLCLEAIDHGGDELSLQGIGEGD